MNQNRAIDVTAIDTSPTNPRKTFPPESIEDLAESIRNKGLLQPILVRPKPEGRFELVFGERRWKAVKLARLHTIDAMIRDLSDEEVVEAQVIENGQREDVHPLEEAVGYQVLIEKHGRSVDDVAAKVGKSKAYVYSRLKLVSLGEKARGLYIEGELSHTIALYVARVPESQQDDALDALLHAQAQYGHNGSLTAAQASSVIQSRFMLRLKDAAFDVTNPGLVPGTPACPDCPKRTGNQLDLYGDVEDDDTCTDATCFQTKAAAAFEGQAAAARAKGLVVITEPEQLLKTFEGRGHHIRYNAPFVALDDKHYDPTSGKHKTVRSIVGKDVAPVILQAPDGSAVQAVPRKALDKALGREQPKKKPTSSWKEASAKHEKKRELEDRIANAVGAAVAEKWEKTEELSAAFWRELAAEAYDNDDYVLDRRGVENAYGGANPSEKYVAKLSVAEMRGFVAEVLFRRRAGYGLTTVAAAKLFGVNAEPIEKREKEAIAAAAKAEKELAKAKAKKKGGKADGAKKDGAAKKPPKTASKKKAAKKSRAQHTVREGVCRVCGCTDFAPCPNGCAWVEPDLCSECVT